MSKTKIKRFGVPILFIVEAATPDEARAKIEGTLECADQEKVGTWQGWGVIEEAEGLPGGVHHITLH